MMNQNAGPRFRLRMHCPAGLSFHVFLVCIISSIGYLPGIDYFCKKYPGMKISYNWLKEYTGQLPLPDDLSVLLTSCGLEVEGTETCGVEPERLKGVVSGLVMEKIKHPNADKLSLTKVDTGTGSLLSVVCGAPNVEAGQKVLVATIGTRIIKPGGDFVIQKSKIRGEVSEGMICAEDELGLGTSHEGILVLDPDTPVGLPASDIFNATLDTVFEIGLTPNRSDAASHLGVARDVLAVMNSRDLGNRKVAWPDVSNFSCGDQDPEINIEIEDSVACPRYSGVTIGGIRVSDSPVWLKERLRAAGIRPLNNVVDITNFVMLETGQPLHAFDADCITGAKVIVKRAVRGQTFVTLDGVERKLDSDDLMICNASEPMCIAGVFGGEKSGVSASTTRVFLESACFQPSSIRKTSKLHGLKTDASFRFERGTDPEITVYALKRAALLMSEITGAKISSGLADVYPRVIPPVEIPFSIRRLNAIAGVNIPEEVLGNILTSLDIRFRKVNDENYHMILPLYRTDVEREIDVVEEVLRIYGYDHIPLPDTIRFPLISSASADEARLQNIVSDYLVYVGFHEILNNSITHSAYYRNLNTGNKPEELVTMLNPISGELDCMRMDLLMGGLESIAFNKNRRNHDLRFFEFGKAYALMNRGSADPRTRYSEHYRMAFLTTGFVNGESWTGSRPEAGFYYLKAMINNVMGRCGIFASTSGFAVAESPPFQGKMLEYRHDGKLLFRMGMVSSDILKAFDIRDQVFYADLDWEWFMELASKTRVSYSAVPRFPEVKRDLALLIPDHVTYAGIEMLAFRTEPFLLQKVTLFDVYKGENLGNGRKSYAVSFILQDTGATLTDSRIEHAMNRLIDAFRKELSAELR